MVKGLSENVNIEINNAEPATFLRAIQQFSYKQ